ncbi:TetR/AcrR family transcriptional regulator [Aeromicrobium sp.]|uniref:TetR/AcrR family transcriptional regulator n=1 Tax=Aeromicrobium sp. TaxID=1871063 RepID=UPI0019C98BDC|nr:TetR/AcrR family transcriptional regulator [Aeromicrobium sp.]MBC7630356.1 TetR/AcrR family transcriptional regulator [Aeromicrobium sp.]
MVQAAELFNTYGYHVASMEDIAAAVGVAKPTLYHYFKSKSDILYAIHDEFIDLIIAEHDARVAAQPHLPADQCLLGIMQDILHLMRTHRGHVRVFFECHRSLRVDQQLAIRAKRDAYAGTVIRLLEQGNTEGKFSCDPEIVTLALFGICNWAYQWYDASGELSTADLAEEFWQILLRGIAAAPGASTVVTMRFPGTLTRPGP